MKHGTNFRILIVDDESINIHLLKNDLQKDYKITAALKGPKALLMAASDNPPDLILLDVEMPSMDGYETCRLLKADERSRDIPVIFITGMGGVKDEAQGLEAGAVDYIIKPFSMPIVNQRIKIHLDYLQRIRELQNRIKELESKDSHS